MLRKFFSPKGALNQQDMFICGGVMILLALIKNLGMFQFEIPIFGLIFLIFLPLSYWIWSVLWVKRYRDVGESGWMALVPIAVYILVFMVASGVFLRGYFSEAMVVGMEDPNNKAAIEEIAMRYIPGYMVKLPWISAITSALVLVAFNLMIRRKPLPDQTGF